MNSPDIYLYSFMLRNGLMSDRVCLDVRTNDKSGRALNPSLSVTETRRERERVERYRVQGDSA